MLTREQLQQFDKDELIELLLRSLEGQQIANENMQKMAEFMEHITTAVEDLRSKNQTLEVENIALRARGGGI